MRIIAGRLGGRTFVSPRGHRTHPMSDKMRGALFNTLGDIDGLTALDAFGGSGALSFEAVSRGALHATIIEKDRTAQDTIADNLRSLRLKDSVKLIRAAAAAWLSTSDQTFDLVLLDPPYEQPQLDILYKLAERTKPGGTVVFSLPPTVQPELPAEFHLLRVKQHGDGQLSLYRRD